MTTKTTPYVTIIGYGNPSRGDDGAGWWVGEEIERRWGDKVEVVLLHQLDVVLADQFQKCDVVIFIDAEKTDRSTGRSLERVYPNNELKEITHTLNPETILALAATLYDAKPEAYLVTVCASRFEVGEPFTPSTQWDGIRALQDVETFLQKLWLPKGSLGTTSDHCT